LYQVQLKFGNKNDNDNQVNDDDLNGHSITDDDVYKGKEIDDTFLREDVLPSVAVQV
jgi:hypothetical protein